MRKSEEIGDSRLLPGRRRKVNFILLRFSNFTVPGTLRNTDSPTSPEFSLGTMGAARLRYMIPISGIRRGLGPPLRPKGLIEIPFRL